MTKLTKKHERQFDAIVEFIQCGGEKNMLFAKNTFKRARAESGSKAAIAERGRLIGEIEELKNELYQIIYSKEAQWTDPSSEEAKEAERTLRNLNIAVEKRRQELLKMVDNILHKLKEGDNND